MGFHAYSSPYDWSRIAPYKTKAAQVPGGIVDLSVGSPVDPVPQSVREALAVASDAKNAHGYPVTAGSGDLRDAIFEWFRAVRGVDLQSINADVVPTVGSKEAVALMASINTIFASPSVYDEVHVSVSDAFKYITMCFFRGISTKEGIHIIDDTFRKHFPGGLFGQNKVRA